jgi:hypothetical protein
MVYTNITSEYTGHTGCRSVAFHLRFRLFMMPSVFDVLFVAPSVHLSTSFFTTVFYLDSISGHNVLNCSLFIAL